MLYCNPNVRWTAELAVITASDSANLSDARGNLPAVLP